MIKLVIFDLDGVLADLRDVHYRALNAALIRHGYQPISREDHLSRFDGLPTRTKLDMLGIRGDELERIKTMKQELTERQIEDMQFDGKVAEIAAALSAPVAVASNAVQRTVERIIGKLGITPELFLSNENVSRPKPSPEIYLRCMLSAGVGPQETLIVEDSHTGRKAAHASGAHVLGVNGTEDVTLERIQQAIRSAEGQPEPKWDGGDMNVLIPMSGYGKRFREAGYTFPKPLIDVAGKPMIQRVVENLNLKAHHIFITAPEYHHKYNLTAMLRLIAPDSTVMMDDTRRRGAATSCLMAHGAIDNDKPLLIANSDQIVAWDVGKFLWSFSGPEIDAGMALFKATHPKWSFAKLDGCRVTEVAEKNPISDNATVGIYYWKRGSDFVKYAQQMIGANRTVNGEFYTCPVFNEAIQDGKFVKGYFVEHMHGLGTPEDLEAYLRETHST